MTTIRFIYALKLNLLWDFYRFTLKSLNLIFLIIFHSAELKSNFILLISRKILLIKIKANINT